MQMVIQAADRGQHLSVKMHDGRPGLAKAGVGAVLDSWTTPLIHPDKAPQDKIIRWIPQRDSISLYCRQEELN